MAFREIETNIRALSAGLMVAIYNAELLSEEDEIEIFQLLFIDDAKIGKIVGDVCAKILIENCKEDEASSPDEKINSIAMFIIRGLKLIHSKKMEISDAPNEDQDEIQKDLMIYIDTLTDSIGCTYDFMGIHVIEHICSTLSGLLDEMVFFSY